MNIFSTYVLPWLIVFGAGFSIYMIVRSRNKRAELQCPQCKNLFGKKAADEIISYDKHEMLDDPMFTLDNFGHDGYIMHCDNCDINVLFDNKNNPVNI